MNESAIKSWEIVGDVVFFRYVPTEVMKSFEEVYVWDLDKTYLDTQWASLRELIRVAREKAFQKRNVPGTSSLVTALKTSWLEKEGRSHFPLFFITASPPQMESRIREKLELDDLLPLGIFFKDNLKNLKPKRMWRLTQQIGYKVQALLQLRALLKENVRQLMWGDDSETDAVIYSLYSDICSRRLSEVELKPLLRQLKVIGEQTETILDLQDRIPEFDPVERIYINLAIDTDPEYYQKFGRRLLPTYHSFQSVHDLEQRKKVSAEQVVRVGLDLMMSYAFSSDELAFGLDDLVRRKVLSFNTVERLLPPLIEHDIISSDYRPSVQPVREMTLSSHGELVFEGEFEPWIPTRVDYLHDYR